MKNRKGAGYVSPADLENLQLCFDALLAQHRLNRESTEADLLASALLLGHSNGIANSEDLMRSAEIIAGLTKGTPD